MADLLHKTIFFDLDGTLISLKNRYIKLFQDFLRSPKAQISSDEYWNLKRLGKSDYDILSGLNENTLTINIAKRLKHIEDKKYLSLDKLHPHTKKILLSLKNYKLTLITMRKNVHNLRDELNNLEINHFFDEVISGKLFDNNQVNGRVVLIRKANNFSPNFSIFVGDTEVDYKIAERLKIPCVLVTYGLRSVNFLKNNCPNVQLANSPLELLKKIKYLEADRNRQK
ncbi:MAG: HAD hydrolase-like protein [Patescibacteria group bacterium]